MVYENITTAKKTETTFDFIIVDSAGSPVDLGAETGQIIIKREQLGEYTTILTKALTVTDASNGVCEVTLTATELDINPIQYDYNLTFTTLGILQQGTFTLTGEAYNRVDEIKTKYGLTFDSGILTRAFVYAKQQMKNNAYISHTENPVVDNNNIFKIDNYLVDANSDGFINKFDIEVKQYMRDYPYTEQDLTNNVVSIMYNHPIGKTIITMDDEYPTTSYTFEVGYYNCSKSYANSKENIEYTEELYMIFHLFDVLEPYKLQKGIPNKTINGVSIEFDRDGIAQYKLQLFHQINNEIIKFRKINFRNVNIDKVY